LKALDSGLQLRISVVQDKWLSQTFWRKKEKWSFLYDVSERHLCWNSYIAYCILLFLQCCKYLLD